MEGPTHDSQFYGVGPISWDSDDLERELAPATGQPRLPPPQPIPARAAEQLTVFPPRPQPISTSGAQPVGLKTPGVARIPMSVDELHQMLKSEVLRRLQCAMKDPTQSPDGGGKTKLSKEKETVMAVDCSSTRARLLSLHAALLDENIRHQKLSLMPTYNGPNVVNMQLNVAIVEALSAVEHVMLPWRNVGAGQNRGQTGEPCPNMKRAKAPSSRARSRSLADTNAQSTVPSWYGRRCVFTGLRIVEGCHIFPVGVSKQNLDLFWTSLAVFWSLNDIDIIQDLLPDPKIAFQNVIPLSNDAHKRLDKHYISMRPIERRRSRTDTGKGKDPEDSRSGTTNVAATGTEELYVQTVATAAINLQTGKRELTHSRDWIDIQGQPDLVGLADWRRCTVDETGQNPSVPAIRSGSVFKITKQSVQDRPLPNAWLMRIRFFLDMIMGSLKAAGAKGDLWPRLPPDVHPVPSSSSPAISDSLLWYLVQDSEETGSLTREEADRWRGALVVWDRNRVRMRRELMLEPGEVLSENEYGADEEPEEEDRGRRKTR